MCFKSFKILIGSALLCTLAGQQALFAKEYKFPQYIRLSVREVGPSEKRVCKRIVRSIEFHLGSFGRYKFVRRGRTLNRMNVYCKSNGTVKLAFLTYTKINQKAKPKPILVSEVAKRFDPRTESVKVFSFGLLKELLAGLPWSGEVSNVVTVDPKESGKKKDGAADAEEVLGQSDSESNHVIADTSTGYITNDVPDICMPVEFGVMLPNKSYKKIGEGVFTDVGAFGSRIEGYLDKDKMQKIPLYYKFFTSKKYQVKIQNIINQCRENAATDESVKALPNQKIGVDNYEAVELQNVKQRGGIMYYTYEADNGLKIPGGTLYYVQNEIDVGRYISLDMKAARHLQTKIWTAPSGYEELPAAITIAEGFLNSRFEFDSFNLQFGGGLFISKINTPYRTKEDEPKYFQSGQKTRAAFLAKWHSYGQVFWSDVRASYSPVAGRGYLSVGLDLNINLSETWFAGSSLNYLETGASELDPSGRLMGFGLHMGFDLHRKQ